MVAAPQKRAEAPVPHKFIWFGGIRGPQADMHCGQPPFATASGPQTGLQLPGPSWGSRVRDLVQSMPSGSQASVENELTVLDRFSARYDPRTPLNGSGSKNGAERKQNYPRRQILEPFRDNFLVTPQKLTCKMAA